MANIAFSILHDEDATFDAVSAALMIIAKNIKSLPSESDADHERHFIYKVTRNAAIDELRKKKMRITPVTLDDYISESMEYIPADEVIRSEEIERIVSVISKMSEANRDVLMMRFVHNLSVVEISKALNLSVNTVKARIKRGRAILSEALSGENHKTEVTENA
jgi:RNA polymerase sigma-70 factor (ECF subfamily)